MEHSLGEGNRASQIPAVLREKDMEAWLPGAHQQRVPQVTENDVNDMSGPGMHGLVFG